MSSQNNSEYPIQYSDSIIQEDKLKDIMKQFGIHNSSNQSSSNQYVTSESYTVDFDNGAKYGKSENSSNQLVEIAQNNYIVRKNGAKQIYQNFSNSQTEIEESLNEESSQSSLNNQNMNYLPQKLTENLTNLQTIQEETVKTKKPRAKSTQLLVLKVKQYKIKQFTPQSLPISFQQFLEIDFEKTPYENLLLGYDSETGYEQNEETEEIETIAGVKIETNYVSFSAENIDQISETAKSIEPITLQKRKSMLSKVQDFIGGLLKQKIKSKPIIKNKSKLNNLTIFDKNIQDAKVSQDQVESAPAPKFEIKIDMSAQAKMDHQFYGEITHHNQNLESQKMQEQFQEPEKDDYGQRSLRRQASFQMLHENDKALNYNIDEKVFSRDLEQIGDESSAYDIRASDALESQELSVGSDGSGSSRESYKSIGSYKANQEQKGYYSKMLKEQLQAQKYRMTQMQAPKYGISKRKTSWMQKTNLKTTSYNLNQKAMEFRKI